MRVEGTWPQESIDGKLVLIDANGTPHDEVYDKDGNVLKIAKWQWTPLFVVADAKPYVQYLQTTDKRDKLVHRSVLALSGSSGRLRLHDRTHPVECALDAKGPPSAKKGKSSSLKDDDLPAPGKKG